MKLLLVIALLMMPTWGKTLGGLFLSFCAIQPDGQTYCFGLNRYGNLGLGRAGAGSIHIQFPRQMLNVNFAVDVSCGQTHTCLVEQTGEIKCVGDNVAATLGDGSRVPSNVLVQVKNLDHSAKQVFAGYQHSCAILVDFTAVCWGDNSFGALGDNSTITRLSPVSLGGLKAIVEVGVGMYHTCAVTMTGRVECVGRDFYGQLGDGLVVDRLLPKPISSTQGNYYTSIVCGSLHTCALLLQGGDEGVQCWGLNKQGQLGLGFVGGISTVPVQPVGLRGGGLVATLWASFHTNFAVLRQNGTVMGFGENLLGALGSGDVKNHATPLIVFGGVAVKQIRGGAFATCAVLENEDGDDDKVWCVGKDDYGALGLSSLELAVVDGLPPGPATPSPTSEPITVVTDTPSVAPTNKPISIAPTNMPISIAPTNMPISIAPTSKPISIAPTSKPITVAPTSNAPTNKPISSAPTSIAPTSVAPSSITPTSVTPTSVAPTKMPITKAPSATVTKPPSVAITKPPSVVAASKQPTGLPTDLPTGLPSLAPTNTKTVEPTAVTFSPTSFPTFKPTRRPTNPKTTVPTTTLPLNNDYEEEDSSTLTPTPFPTFKPTARPTVLVTLEPTTLSPTSQLPTLSPTAFPTFKPTQKPTTTPTTSQPWSYLRETSGPAIFPSDDAPTLPVNNSYWGLIALVPIVIVAAFYARRQRQQQQSRRPSKSGSMPLGAYKPKTVRFD